MWETGPNACRYSARVYWRLYGVVDPDCGLKEKLGLMPFSASVKADKAKDMPSRFGLYDIQVTSGLSSDQQFEMLMIKQAKATCTVSNSLDGETDLKFDD